VSADLTPANANIGKPRYTSMTDWAGGATGDDVSQATAVVALANSSGGAPAADYSPRTQAQKVTAQNPLVVDVGRPRGTVAPGQPYPVAATPAPAAPVVTGLTPATAPTTSLPLTVTITGTGFTVWSTVYTGGSNVPEAEAVFVNSTTMKVPIWKATPGTVSVAVKDHDVLSNADQLFTVT